MLAKGEETAVMLMNPRHSVDAFRKRLLDAERYQLINGPGLGCTGIPRSDLLQGPRHMWILSS
jgi:hypothetical protein